LNFNRVTHGLFFSGSMPKMGFEIELRQIFARG
jgi:hypothetical protein